MDIVIGVVWGTRAATYISSLMVNMLIFIIENGFIVYRGISQENRIPSNLFITDGSEFSVR